MGAKLQKLLVWNDRFRNRVIAATVIGGIAYVAIALWNYQATEESFDRIGLLIQILQ